MNKNYEIVLIFCLFWVLDQSKEFLYLKFGSNGDFPSWNRSHDPAPLLAILDPFGALSQSESFS